MSLLNTPFDPAREAALVTGAGNGIGRAIAQALVGEGLRTVFADISADRLTAAIAAVFTVRFLVKWFQTRTLTPFAIYCLLFGLAMVIYNS